MENISYVPTIADLLDKAIKELEAQLEQMKVARAALNYGAAALTPAPPIRRRARKPRTSAPAPAVRNRIPVADREGAIIHLLDQQPTMTAKEIGDGIGVGTSHARNILRGMADKGMVAEGRSAGRAHASSWTRM